MDEFGDAHALLMAGDYAAAIDAYNAILAREPGNPAALQNLALCCYQAADLAGAGAAVESLLAVSPGNVSGYHIQGLVKLAQGDVGGATTAFENVVALNPADAASHNELGNLYLRQGAPENARAAFAKATHLEPNAPLPIYNLAVAVQQLGDAGAAAELFENAIRLKPDFAEAYCNLGLALVDQGKDDEAITAYGRALEIRPDFPEAYANLAKPLVTQRRLAEAQDALKKALDLRPDYPVALENYAAVLKLTGDVAAALAFSERLVALSPENKKARTDQAHMRRTLCDWSSYDEDVRYLRSNPDSVEPFVFLNTGAGAAEQLVCARHWAAKHPSQAGFARPLPKTKKKKLNIGYLSADFRRHATAYLIAELFERHDREKFNILGFSIGYHDDSAERSRLEKGFDKFFDLEKSSHAASAQVIFDNEIDILVDLKGYTGGARTEILQLRPAPVQVNYLGYPGTMGADFIDYIVSDPVISPLDHQCFYSEAIVQLPFSYQPNDTQRKINETAFSRADFGLPQDGFVFCSFNGSYKFTPATFDIWMRLLAAAPSSVLWLLNTSDQAEANLRREAAARGVDPARLVFSPAMESSAHLARHALADLFLDTLPINAHTTASDALWAGLPVLTVLGDSFVGRVAASLLHAVGLPEMVAPSLADYEATALALARDPKRLAALKQKLASNIAQAPLFAIEPYTRHLEAAYQGMWDRYAKGRPPEPFSIAP